MSYLVFASGTDTSDDTAQHSGERLLNMFFSPNTNPEKHLSPGIVKSFSGMKEIADLGAPIRALIAVPGAIYAAADSALWTVSDSGFGRIGGIADGRTVMSYNGRHVAVAVDGKYYVWTGAEMVSPPVDPLTYVQDLAFLDQRIILAGSDTGQFMVTGLADATNISALDFATAESKPDGITAIQALRKELHIYGSDSFELWAGTGQTATDIDPGFPFAPVPGGNFDQGAIEGTVDTFGNTAYWVSPDNYVYAGAGLQPQRVSTPNIEEQLRAKGVLHAFIFKDRGEVFYAVQPRTGPALVLPLSTRLWCERNSGVDGGKWLATCAASEGGSQYLGGFDGKIYMLDENTHKDGSFSIDKRAVCVPRMQDGPVSRLKLKVRTGHATGSVRMRTTRDGKTWSTERIRQLPPIGDYEHEIRYNGLGRFRRFQAELRSTDDIRFDIHGAKIE